MTVFMLITQRFLLRGQRYALPPEIITADVARRTHMRWHMNKKLVLAATTLSHFGYGAAMGALYKPVEKSNALPAAVKGALFGLLVWGGSYLVLLPLLRLGTSGQREPGQRNLMMIVAHGIWGATMGIMTEMRER